MREHSAQRGLRAQVRSLAIAAVLAMLLSTVVVVQLASSSIATAAGAWRMDTSTLQVLGWNASSSTPGAAIASYSWMINVDNTGTTEQRSWTDGCSPQDPNYPSSCQWTSMGVTSGAPVYAQGTEADVATGLDVAPGRYLISVLADGYKLDGAHFTVLDDGSLADPSGVVTVYMQPQPLPDATIQAAVFEDISPVNSGPDLPAEHGLAGFSGQVRDSLGQVTTDVYGDPLCGNGTCLSYCWVVDSGVDLGYTPSDADGRCPTMSDQLAVGDSTGLLYLPKSDAPPFPTLATIAAGATTPVPATAAIEGKIEIPNLGTNRFTLSVTPPDGSNFIQTTTLEGNHDWDSWVMEGTNGLDTEFAIAGEPFPAIIFGYVPAGPTSGPFDRNVYGVDGESAGSITGVVDEVKVYVPSVGGILNGGTIWGGMMGGKISKPMPNAWVSLTDLVDGDTAVWVGQTDANGRFTIPHVPDGMYTLTWWDEPQDYILDLQNVTVENGELVDTGVLPLTGWWTQYDGYVFNDTNRNGIMDWNDSNGNGCPDAGEGELGVPNYTLTLRRRENTLMDRGTTTVGTDACGHYYMESAYPMTQWLVMEAYNDLYYTTGVTYQADNQNEPTTVLGSGVDVSVLPIIGLAGRMDWGVHPYDAKGVTHGLDPRNGGIVGTVSYDTTRNELDPRYAAVEDWQPGVSGLTVDLYTPVQCADPDTQSCDAAGMYQLDPDGSYTKGTLINTYVTEQWQQPGKNDDGVCIPRDEDGNELTYPDGQQITNNPSDCLEGPLMGVQFQHGFSAVDGNYGFGDGCFNGTLDATDPNAPVCVGGEFTALPAGDYLVHVNNATDSQGKPVYQFTREEDINIGDGDAFVPLQPPAACAGALHTVDVAGIGSDGPNAVVNPTFADLGGSPYEGQARPLCDTKLVPLANGRSIVPTFNVFTKVPLPGRFWGLVVDDLNFSSDPHQINYGEKAGVPFAPVGIYDYTNRLVYTTESDYSGLFDVLMPSTNRINCPTPSGVCGNVYRFVGNDPGGVGQLNANYHPEFRTIAADFEALPGNLIPADLAPTQVGVTVQLPSGQATTVQCAVAPSTPELFAVNRPYVDNTGNVIIEGQHFGAEQGNGSVTLTTAAGIVSTLAVVSWSDTHIEATVDAGVPAGPQQLSVTSDTGDSTANGITMHVIRAANLAAFPATDVLDTFNRAENGNLGTNWSTPLGGYAIRNSQMSVRGLSLPIINTRIPNTASWNTIFAADQEAYVTIARPITNKEVGVALKQAGNLGIRVVRTNNGVELRAQKSLTGYSVVRTWNTPVGAGSVLGARALGNGAVTVYVKNGATVTTLGTVNLVTGAGSNNWGAGNRWDTTQAATTGRIGVYSYAVAVSNADNTNDPRLDDFGGGALVTGSYAPTVREVGPGKAYATIQSAIDAAEAAQGDQLVVVYPNTPVVRTNPRGAYYENLIVTKPIKLQGVGPGGVRGTETVNGSIIDGSAYGGDGQTAANWWNRVDSLTWDGNQTPYDGAVVSYYTRSGVFAPSTNNGGFSEPSFKGALDGFDLRGGDQQGFPGNLNAIGGGNTGIPASVQTQGGAVFANAYARYLQITNNVVQNNGGAYGTIRIGTPDLAAGENHNERVRIAHNRVIQNGGTNLAGGIGLFAESDGYTVADNDICGNFSAEYGGALTAMGYSPGGRIDHNRIWFNRSYDEGGAIMIAGELPADPTVLSQGSGSVVISRNVIQSNLSNDDGGGLRFLMAGNYPMDVWGNMIVNNVSTHEGGGVAIDDAPNVRFHDNTVMKNITTATALTSDGSPAPAGLSTGENSQPLKDQLNSTNSPFRVWPYSRPTMFNNIFWDNRAGTRSTELVLGIGATGDQTPIDHWDVGIAGVAGSLAPTNSVIQQDAGIHTFTTSATNTSIDPGVVLPYDTQVSFNAWRTNPNFIGAFLVSLDLPPELLGDYHLAAATSSAVNRGAASVTAPGNVVVSASTPDIDGEPRPSGAAFDIGADELITAPGRFPSTARLDTFNRANNANLGTSWSKPSTGYSINGNRLRAAAGTATGVTALSRAITRTTQYGANQEAYVQITTASGTQVQQGLVVKATANGASMIIVTVDPSTATYKVWTKTNGQAPVLRQTGGFSMALSAGQAPQLGVRASYDGMVRIYRNSVELWSQDFDQVGYWPTSLVRTGGLIGVMATGTTAARVATFDNFGGGNQR